MPLLRRGGCLLAMKGESAIGEVARTPGLDAEVVELGAEADRTWVVRVWKERQ